MTRRQVADLFEVDDSTIDRYLAANEAELRHNGYVLMRGTPLKNIQLQFGSLINAGSKTTQLGMFTLRAVLNLAMLLVESERARAIRRRMLDIVLDTIAERAGGHTKYINQRDRDSLPSAFQESQHRKDFTLRPERLRGDGQLQVRLLHRPHLPEHLQGVAREYRKVLQLADGDKPRDTSMRKYSSSSPVSRQVWRTSWRRNARSSAANCSRRKLIRSSHAFRATRCRTAVA